MMVFLLSQSGVETSAGEEFTFYRRFVVRGNCVFGEIKIYYFLINKYFDFDFGSNI